MKMAQATLVLVVALTLAGCGTAGKPSAGETNISPQKPAEQTQTPAPPAPAPAVAPAPALPMVTGKIQVHVGAVKLHGGGGKERDYLEGLGPMDGATVIFFVGDQVLGQAKTKESGWTDAFTVTVPMDERVALLYSAYKAAGKVEDLPGVVSVLVTKEGYHPTVMTNLGVQAEKSVGYGGVNMFKLGDPVQTEGVDMAPDGPMTQAMGLGPDNRGSHLGRDLVQTIQEQVSARKVPELKE